ncbi:MAG: hypothetical protein HC778_03355 [Chamaesiphon sp. CSU_1_12]|nr:hypothetical protein [Chamaesiphon sp. CSU_1_12]
MVNTPGCGSTNLVTATIPTTVTRPSDLFAARTYRCSFDDPSVNYRALNTDFCLTSKAGLDLERTLAVVSDRVGNYRTFTYIDDFKTGANYSISVVNLAPSLPNVSASFPISSPIYLIQEKVYSLLDTGELTVAIDRISPTLLLSKVQQFSVAVRLYAENNPLIPDPIDGINYPTSRRCDPIIEQYICDFNHSSIDDWKLIKGVRLTIDMKYNSIGRDLIPTPTDLSKLKTIAEFYPRNTIAK